MRNETLAPPTVTSVLATLIVFTMLLSSVFFNTILPVNFSTFSLNVRTAVNAIELFIEVFIGDKAAIAGAIISVTEFLGVGGVILVKSAKLSIVSDPIGVL